MSLKYRRDDPLALLSTVKSADEFQLDVEYLRQVLDYNPDTGVITWRARTSTRNQVGDVAGAVGQGYRKICVGRTDFLAHVLAWVILHGRLPDGDIDHVNGDGTDNREINLREVTRSVNNENQKKPHKGNKSGYLGVAKVSRGHNTYYLASINVNKQTHYLGCFKCPKKASRRYLKAKRELHVGNTL